MKKIMVVFTLLAMLSFSPMPANAWNADGHRVVAQIAWDNTNTATKRRVIAALRQALAGSRLDRNGPFPSNINSTVYADYFQFAATWPDVIRGNTRFHRGDWHFRDLLWNGSDGSNSDLESGGQMLVKLIELSEQDPAESEDDVDTNPAVRVAWLEHLIGDVHQPLHSSGRITNAPGESNGDEGGNSFCLEVASRCSRRDARKLHTFWDNLLTETYARQPGERDFAYCKRVADDIARRFPKSDFTDLDGFDGTNKWLREGRDRARDSAYPASLRRNREPSNTYRMRSLRVAERAIAQGGYRLAQTLESKFSN